MGPHTPLRAPRLGGPRTVESRRRGRRAFRLRVHIATLFVALIASAGLLIVGYGYVATSHLLLAAGDEEFLHVAERTAGHVRDLLAPAHLLVQLLAQHQLTASASLSARLEVLPLLSTALAEHPEISAVYVGFRSGDFFLVRSLHGVVRQSVRAPPQAVFLVQSRTAAQGAAVGQYLFLDGHLGILRDESRPDYRFDPRTREWYRQALRGPAPVRTSPYVFFTTREVGTTLAQRSAGRRKCGWRRYHAPRPLAPPGPIPSHALRADGPRRSARSGDRPPRRRPARPLLAGRRRRYHSA
jgi:hypothetical protein